MDNQSCVQMMKIEEEGQSANKLFFKACKDLVAKPQWVMMFSHVFRETNQAVDWLSNKGINLGSIIVFYYPHLKQLLRSDSQGIIRSSFVNLYLWVLPFIA